MSSAVKFSGGDKLSTKLDEIRKNIGGKTTLSVGFFGDATEDNGVNTAMVAALNEFGGTIKVPEHQQTIYHLVNERTQTFLRGGKFVQAAKSNYERVVTVPAHTITRPPRPFFQRMIHNGKPHWGADLGKIMVAVNYDAKLALATLGDEMAGALLDSINAQVYAPLAASTIRAKGSAITLTETADMKRSIGREIT